MIIIPLLVVCSSVTVLLAKCLHFLLQLIALSSWTTLTQEIYMGQKKCVNVYAVSVTAKKNCDANIG